MTEHFGSIADTGAVPGDLAVCVDPCDEVLRYTKGRKYPVVDHFGRPHIHGNTHGKLCGAGEERWLIPFEGFGARWARA